MQEHVEMQSNGWQKTIDELREQKHNAEKYSAKLEEQLCSQFKELDSLTKVGILDFILHLKNDSIQYVHLSPCHCAELWFLAKNARDRLETMVCRQKHLRSVG